MFREPGRGVSGERNLMEKRPLKSAMLTIITLLALSIGILAVQRSLKYFMWDGVGKLAVDAITTRDYR